MATIDGNSNQITVEDTGLRFGENRILKCRLVDDPQRGYLVEELPGGSFGDETCHSSYGMHGICWFGNGESATEAEALAFAKGFAKGLA